MAPHNALYRWAWTITGTKEDMPGTVAMVKAAFDACGGYSKLTFQLERGEEAGNLHWQGVVTLKEKKRLQYLVNVFWEMFESLDFMTREKIHFSQIRNSAAAYKEAEKYARKEDTRVTLEDSSIETAFNTEPVPAEDREYSMRELGLDNIDRKLLPWQRSVVNILETKPDDRSVHWIYDEIGNNGKSHLWKWLAAKKFKGKIMRLPMAKAHQLRQIIAKHGHGKTMFVFDITRTIGDNDSVRDLIALMEELKNGWIQGAMGGEYVELFFPSPHVFATCNHMPPEGCMSGDRIIVYVIGSDKQLYTKGRPPLRDFEAAKREIEESKGAVEEKESKDDYPSGRDAPEPEFWQGTEIEMPAPGDLSCAGTRDPRRMTSTPPALPRVDAVRPLPAVIVSDSEGEEMPVRRAPKRARGGAGGESSDEEVPETPPAQRGRYYAELEAEWDDK